MIELKKKKKCFQILALKDLTYDEFEAKYQSSFIHSRLTVMTPIDIIRCHTSQNPYTDLTWKFIFIANTEKKKYKIVIGYERF